MRPASSRVAVWISVLAVLVALFALAGPTFAQAKHTSKRKLSQSALSGHLITASAIASRPAAKSQAPPPNTPDNWTGLGDGTNWSSAGNWSAGVPNGSTIDVTIGTTTASVIDNISPSVGNLTLSHAGDSLTIANNQTLSVFGTINNSGTITLGSTGNNTFLDLGASLTLSGTGTLVLGSSGPNFIYSVGGSNFTLTNASNITGTGNIGNGALTLVNTGTINANLSGLGLTLQPGGASTNTGTLEATNGGGLGFNGGSWTNTVGTISAQTGSAVDLYNNASITGGTLTTSGTGVIHSLGGNTAFLTGLTNAGTYAIDNNSTTVLSGTITNNGTLQLNSTGNNTFLNLGANATLAGTGTVVMGASGPNYIYSVGGSNFTLTNATTITGGNATGTDNIGNGALTLVNNGTINANVSGTGITLQPGGASTNTKTLEATNGGGLGFNGGSWTNIGGTISAQAGSSVVLYNNVSITGGTLTTSGTGVIHSLGGNTAFLTGLTNAGTYAIDNNSTTVLSGTITNNGTLQLNSTGNATFLDVTNTGSQSATLAGTGTVVLGAGGPNYIYSVNGNASTLTNATTITGVGNIGNGVLTLVNNATIDANVSPTVSSGALSIVPGAGGVTNTATLEATNGGTLVLTGSFTNTGSSAVIEALGTDSSSNASTVVLSNATINGGTLTTNGSDLIVSAGGTTNTLNSVTNTGTYDVANNSTTVISGTITNNGTLQLNSTGNNTFLNLGSNTTLTGAGTVVLGSGGPNFIDSVNGSNFTLTNASTITGVGNIGNGHLTLVNNGTINANVNGAGITLQPGGASINTKTLEATNGGGLGLNGGSWTNTGGTISAQTGSSVVLYNNVSITGGTLTTSGTGVIHSLGGNSAFLSGLTNAGTYAIDNNSTTVISGTITNNGTLQLNSTGNNTFLNLGANATLAGTGTVVMGASGPNYIYGVGGGNFTLTNAITITGGNASGTDNIGNGALTLVNNGTINANVSGAGITLQPGGASTNTKTLEATNGGSLGFNGGSWTNTGGTISAQAGSSVVLYNNASITGGTLTTSGTGVIHSLGGNTAFLTGLTNAGTYAIDNNSTTVLSGTITNNGAMQLNSTGNNTFLDINGAVTLKGTGTLTLGSSGPNYIVGTGITPILTNQSTIQGTGNIGNGSMGLTNTGTLNSNVAGGTLAIVVNGSGFTNYSGTTDTLTGGTYIANGGNITFAAGNNTGITTLAASVTEEAGGQLINTTNNSNALAGLTSITSAGSLTIGGPTFADAGSFSNAGSLTILGGESFTVGSLTQISGGSLTAGTYVLAANLNLSGAAQTITTNAATLTLAGGTIHNNSGGTNALAGLATNTGKLTIAGTSNNVSTTAASFSNTGTLTINGSDSFTAGNLTQISGGTLTAGTYVLGGNLDLTTAGINVTTNSSTLTLQGGTIMSGATNALAALNKNTKTLTLASNANFTTAGNFTNSGTMTVNSGSTFAVNGSLTNYNSTTKTLTGGTYTVGGVLSAIGLDIVTDAANITLSGTGQLKNATGGTNALANLTTISSTGALTLASNANLTAAGNFTNSGKLTVNSGSTFGVTGTLTNLASGTLTGGTYTVGGTMQLASTNGGITTNAATLTLTGTAAKIMNGTSNALAGFNNNTGSFTLAGNALLTTASSNFTNSGTVVVSKGSTLTVGGTTNSYNQSAGTTTVDGTLVGKGTTGISVTGGAIQGAGTLKTNVSIGGSGTTPTINVGDAGKAGLLSITGTYAQLSTGTMNVSIGGATVGTQYSQLKITGAASLGGTLTAAEVNAFVPTVGQTFTVLTASSVSGTFLNSTIAINSTEHYAVSYTSTGVVLTVVSGPASNSSSSSQPVAPIAMASSKLSMPVSKAPILTSGVKHQLGTSGGKTAAKPVLVAGLKSSGRSNTILGAGSDLANRRGLPSTAVASSWNSVEPVTAAVSQLPKALNVNSVRSGLQLSNNLVGQTQAIAVRSALRGGLGTSNMRQLPIKMMRMPQLQHLR